MMSTNRLVIYINNGIYCTNTMHIVVVSSIYLDKLKFSSPLILIDTSAES